MKNFEMADSKNPMSIIKATQKSVITALRDLMHSLEETIDANGLSFDQIHRILDAYENKEPKVIFQSEDQ